jgi:hypothetical protein
VPLTIGADGSVAGIQLALEYRHGSVIRTAVRRRPFCERLVPVKGSTYEYPPLCEMSDLQRREFQEALLDADAFEDLPGKWQGAILKAEENRPNLRIVGSE